MIAQYLPTLLAIGSTFIAAYFMMRKIDSVMDEIFGEEGYVDQIGTQVSHVLKSNFLSQMQGKSVDSRLTNTLKQKMARGFVEQQNPLMALGIQKIFGDDVFKYVSQHPQLLGQILSMLPPGTVDRFMNIGQQQPLNKSNGTVGYG